MLLRASRVAEVLSKAASNVPGIPGLAGEGAANLPTPTPAGTEGRLLNQAAPKAKIREMQAPRAYAPRLSVPSP
jgi:hypothetical protein